MRALLFPAVPNLCTCSVFVAVLSAKACGYPAPYGVEAVRGQFLQVATMMESCSYDMIHFDTQALKVSCCGATEREGMHARA